LELYYTLKGEKMKESKFKIGDLVQLSAAGKRSHQNGMYNYDGAWGMVVRFEKYNQFPIVCEWYGAARHHCGPNNYATFKQYELKWKRK
jgi:hypothetical protein